QPLGAIPGLGEPPDAVLTEIGVTPDELRQLRADGAIGPAYRG
ncbi:MAG: CoA transferase, partial [Mycolicibacterium sp.]